MEKYLDRCLSSLIVDSATMSQMEVLVINDGSTDNSSEIARKYEHRFPFTFRVIDKENGHYGSCINAGLLIASGKYIKILDSDDWFQGENIPSYLAFLNDNDFDMVLSDALIMQTDGVIKRRASFSFSKKGVISLNNFNPADYQVIQHHNLAYRTNLLKQIAYKQTEGISYTDLEWIVKPLVAVSKAGYFNEVVYVYERGREDQSVAPSIHSKNMWMENKVVLGLSRYYEEVKMDNKSKNLGTISGIVVSFIDRIYWHYLVNIPKLLDNRQLISFDRQLKDISEELYEKVSRAEDKRKFMTLKYVRQWRLFKSRNTPVFWLYDIGRSIGYTLRKVIVPAIF